jgi:uncharacterized membrane protein YdjX (TVP38/TMEM64 family)
MDGAAPRWRVLLLLAGAALLVVLARQLPADALRAWVESLGAWGPAGLALVYLLAPLLLVPGAPLSLLAGALFGVTTGVLVVLPAATFGATLAFLAGRHLLRERVAQRLAGHARLASLDQAVGRQGLRLVLLLRLTPVLPFNLLNYALGLTRVRLAEYVLGSLFGMVPGALLYVSAGAAAGEVAAPSGRSPLEWSLLGLGLLATVVLTVLVTRLARRALDEAAPRDGGPGTPGGVT